MAKALAFCLLALPLVGTVSKSVPKPRAKPLATAPEALASQRNFVAELRQGAAFFSESRYSEARKQFQYVLSGASMAHDMRSVARATGNIGGCQFALHEYQAALRSFMEARRLAGIAHDESAVAGLDANIASLFTDTGNLEAAAQWTQGALEHISGEDRRLHLPQIQIQLATLRFRQGRTPEALKLFREGIDGASRANDPDLNALGLNRLGQERLRAHDLAGAEGPLLEAYRIRKLNHLSLDGSYRSLGWLRLEQHDLESASALLDLAIELATSPRGILPSWDMYHYRGRVRMAQGRLKEAMDDLRIAVRLARVWAWLASPDDAARIGAEGWLDRVYSALIETGNRLYLQTGDPALIRETFEAAEENRASSLRTLLNAHGDAVPMSPAYLEAMRRLQTAEVHALRDGSSGSEEKIRSANAELAMLDASIGAAPQLPTQGVLRRAQSLLDSNSALITFHLSATGCWMWAVDRNGLAIYSLPTQASISEQVKQTATAMREDLPDAAASGARLYGMTFARLAPRFQTKSRWLLALDDELFEMPLAALRLTAQPESAYLVERHITQVIPGAAHWVEASEQRNPALLSPVFVGIGDPIYNVADPRRANGTAPAQAIAATRLSLPRLVGSRTEIESSAIAWNGERILLEGVDATRKNVMEALARNPAVVHFATHVVESSSDQRYGLIALTLTQRGETELLQPVEIARWRMHAGLVALSGCSSSAGKTLPGTGRLGLTRAWLTAGADAVVSSRWTMPDDSGALFTALYRRLGSGSRLDPASALRSAQLEMLHSGDWRAHPRYWASYFVMGKD
jgi:CHAT domain-containing protein